MGITYEPQKTWGHIKVFLDGKHVGAIKQAVSGAYFYKPKGGERGEGFTTIAEVKRSLESA